MIFTSGTMSPLDSWEKELNIEAKIKLSNKHVIKSEQIQLNILKAGFGGKSLNFSFRNLNSNKEIIYK